MKRMQELKLKFMCSKRARWSSLICQQVLSQIASLVIRHSPASMYIFVRFSREKIAKWSINFSLLLTPSITTLHCAFRHPLQCNERSQGQSLICHLLLCAQIAGFIKEKKINGVNHKFLSFINSLHCHFTLYLYMSVYATVLLKTAKYW